MEVAISQEIYGLLHRSAVDLVNLDASSDLPQQGDAQLPAQMLAEVGQSALHVESREALVREIEAEAREE